MLSDALINAFADALGYEEVMGGGSGIPRIETPFTREEFVAQHMKDKIKGVLADEASNTARIEEMAKPLDVEAIDVAK